MTLLFSAIGKIAAALAIGFLIGAVVRADESMSPSTPMLGMNMGRVGTLQFRSRPIDSFGVPGGSETSVGLVRFIGEGVSSYLGWEDWQNRFLGTAHSILHIRAAKNISPTTSLGFTVSSGSARYRSRGLLRLNMSHCY